MGLEIFLRRTAVVAFLSLAWSSAVLAAPSKSSSPKGSIAVPGYVAPLLRPWVPWVLFGHEAELCPFLTGDEDSQRVCSWPATLELSLDGKGGRFVQRVMVRAEEAVALPGDDKRWPQEVKVNGAPAPLVLLEARPSIRLGPGEQTISGTFRWDSLPEALAVPPEIGLLALTVRGERISYPTRDEEGVVWLEKESVAGNEEQVLDLEVHRKVIDEVPLQLVTRVHLQVAGKNREELLGHALPKGFVPMSISSQLPARLEPDGRLRVQVRPGDFDVEILARHEGPVESLTPPSSTDGQWPEEEIWVFEARPHLRQVVVDGVPALDPQQTTLPQDWKKLPVYRVRSGEAMTMVEKQRGDAEPAPDRLALARTLWLDMDGQGFSFRDQLTGTMSRSSRLSMPSPSELGYVSVAGQDVLITRLSSDQSHGIEASQGQLQLVAEGRIEGRRSTIPAVGWESDFQSASATLHLPPGWRLLAARGADDVPGTWVRTWSLLDLFLLLITALAFARLFGRRAGLLALVALVLIFPESGSPRWVWLVVLTCEALVRVLPEGWWRQALRAVRLASIGGLALIAVAFSVEQVRVGLHPVLERPDEALGEVQSERLYSKLRVQPEETAGEVAEQLEIGAKPSLLPQAAPSLKGGLNSNVPKSKAQRPNINNQYRYEYDAKAAVQTGKGLPRWGWRQISIQWSGPVDRGQQLTLVLAPPFVNTALAFVRVLLLALLFLVSCSLPRNPLGRLFSRSIPAAALTVFLTVLAPPAHAQETDEPNADVGASKVTASPHLGPPPMLLEELRERLVKPPQCHPNCGSIPRMALEARPGWLQARMEVHAQADTGIPLPSDPQSFMPQRVLLDGKPAALRRGEESKLWVLVPKGMHQLLLEGPLPKSEVVTLALPMRPHRVEARAEGYSVEGIREDGMAEESLQLTRVSHQRGGAATLAPGQLPSFVRVDRTLRLGLTWQTTTRVVRLTPVGAAVVLEVPLIAGEQVTTPGLRVVNGKVQVHMAPQATAVEWQSALEIHDSVKLEAASLGFVESWQLDASPVWHVTWDGIPTIHAADPNGRVPEWRPWPGESVTLTVVRPEAVPGQTLTLNQSQLVVKPGLRSTESMLTLLMRSSRGGLHSIRLPAGAELQSVSIQGQNQPIRPTGDQLPLPIVPGEQQMQITWRQPLGISSLFKVPVVDVGLSNVNADLRIEVPSQRWVLFAGGAPIGPAVLFWNLLLVLLLVALGLGHLGWAPLRWWSWMLLAVGLTQVPIYVAAIPVAWLLLLEWRRRSPMVGRSWFNLRQVCVVLMTLAALGVLFVSIEQGLLGIPDMQVQGNGSSGASLRWFVDRSGTALPQPWVLSLPLLAYRGLMLAWALWIAWSLLSWLRWGWGCFTTGGTWLSKTPPAPPVVAAPPTSQTEPVAPIETTPWPPKPAEPPNQKKK